MLVDRCAGTAQLKKFFLNYSLLLSPLMSSHRTAKTFFIK